MGRSIIGQEHIVERLILGLLCNGNLLVEGLPGQAKTRAVKSLAKNLESDFSRIQFTPGLLPSDVTGTTHRCLHSIPSPNRPGNTRISSARSRGWHEGGERYGHAEISEVLDLCDCRGGWHRADLVLWRQLGAGLGVGYGQDQQQAREDAGPVGRGPHPDPGHHPLWRASPFAARAGSSSGMWS